MQTLKQIFNFYINSSIHVALAAYALTWITLLDYGISYDENALYFVFFATIGGYNFVKYFGLVKFHHRSLTQWLKVIQIVSVIALVAMCYYLIQLKPNVLLLILILAAVTFLYAIPIVPKHYLFDEQKNLREISGLKVYVIGIVWALVTVILPLLNNNIDINSDVMIIVFQRFFYVLVLMLPFEIRDLNYDSLKLATIPQKIGVKKTKLIGMFLLMLFLMLDFFKEDKGASNIITLTLITLVTLLSLMFSNKRQSKYYSAFWVESLPLIWLGLVLVFR